MSLIADQGTATTSGSIVVKTENAGTSLTDGVSGYLTFFSGNVDGTGASKGNSGKLSIGSGDTSHPLSSSGSITVTQVNQQLVAILAVLPSIRRISLNGNSGGFLLSSGLSGAVGDSGSFTFASGTTADGDSGSFTLSSESPLVYSRFWIIYSRIW